MAKTVPVGTRVQISDSSDIVSNVRGITCVTVTHPVHDRDTAGDWVLDAGGNTWCVPSQYFTVLSPEPVIPEKVVSAPRQIYAKRLLVED